MAIQKITLALKCFSLSSTCLEPNNTFQFLLCATRSRGRLSLVHRPLMNSGREIRCSSRCAPFCSFAYVVGMPHFFALVGNFRPMRRLTIRRVSMLSSILHSHRFWSGELFLFIHAYNFVCSSVPIVPPLAVVSVASKVYWLHEKKGSKDTVSRPKEKMKLRSHHFSYEKLSEVTKTTRLALRDAFVSRHYGQVWDPNMIQVRVDCVVALVRHQADSRIHKAADWLRRARPAREHSRAYVNDGQGSAGEVQVCVERDKGPHA